MAHNAVFNGPLSLLRDYRALVRTEAKRTLRNGGLLFFAHGGERGLSQDA